MPKIFVNGQFYFKLSSNTWSHVFFGTQCPLCFIKQTPVVFANKSQKSGPISAIFTARRVCIARPMPWRHVCQSVRPSVCPSHADILWKRLHVSSNVFLPSGRQTILVSPRQTGWQYSDEDPLNGGVEYRGVWIITVFDQYLGNVTR